MMRCSCMHCHSLLALCDRSIFRHEQLWLCRCMSTQTPSVIDLSSTVWGSWPGVAHTAEAQFVLILVNRSLFMVLCSSLDGILRCSIRHATPDGLKAAWGRSSGWTLRKRSRTLWCIDNWLCDGQRFRWKPRLVDDVDKLLPEGIKMIACDTYLSY